jgi:hypothetical protein
MTMASQSVASVDPFAQAREALESVFEELTKAGASHHVALGKLVTDGMTRVGAHALQGHLDALFAKEQQEVEHWARPEGSEVRARRRHLETDFGRMTVNRHGLKLAGETDARFPRDQHLSLPPEIYALSLREGIADAAVEASFARSVERIDHATAGHVPQRQAEELVLRAAADFETFYATRTPPANDALSAKALQVMSSDCKGVTMRPEALRDATRKAAEAAHADAILGDPMAERKARRSDKRMAVVTAVWEQEPHARSAQDVLERLHRDPKGRKRRPRSDKAPRPQNKRVAASLVKSNAEGVAEMFDEAQRRNPDGERRNVVLVDGDEKQIEYVETEARKHQMAITVVLDLIHVIHYLWTIALLLCGGVHKEADAWWSATSWCKCSPVIPSTSSRPSARQPPIDDSLPPTAGPSTRPSNTCARTRSTSTTLSSSPTACRLPRVSSRAHAVTSSRTEWGSPAPDGVLLSPKPCSSCAPSAPVATGTITGASTWKKNTRATTPTRKQLDHARSGRAAPNLDPNNPVHVLAVVAWLRGGR